MTRLIGGAIVFSILFSSHSAAQRGGVHVGAGGRGFPTNVGLPPLRPIPPPFGGLHSSNNFRGGVRTLGFGLGTGFGWWYPGYYGGGYGYYGGYDYPVNYSYGCQSTPNVIVMTPAAESPSVAAPPPPPVKPEMHEYNWPKSDSDPPAAFSIVAKNGTVYLATAVWVQDDTVRFTTPDGAGGHLPLASVALQNTRAANAEKNLKLSLPAE